MATLEQEHGKVEQLKHASALGAEQSFELAMSFFPCFLKVSRASIPDERREEEKQGRFLLFFLC